LLVREYAILHLHKKFKKNALQKSEVLINSCQNVNTPVWSEFGVPKKWNSCIESLLKLTENSTSKYTYPHWTSQASWNNLGSNMDVNLCLQLAFIARVTLFRQQHNKKLDFPSFSLSEQSITSKIWSSIRQWLMSELVQSTYGSSLSASIKVNSRTWNCITWDWDPRFILQPLTISCNIFTAAPFLIPRGCTVQLGYQKQNTNKYQSAEITIVNVTDKALSWMTKLS
jgi:hypothetical protein